MRLSNLSQPLFSSKDIIQEIYKGNLEQIVNCKIDIQDEDYLKYINFVQDNQLDDWPIPEPFVESQENISEFDRKNQEIWFMPDEYKHLDIEQYLYTFCKTSEEKERVAQDLKLYKEQGMINVLRFLKYLVDKMRTNNIVWGVGRGSSVASFCLYLIGIHKINSLKYQLDIREFLRGD